MSKTRASFGKTSIKKNTPSTPFHRVCALKLKMGLQTATRSLSPVSTSSWTKEFAKLQKEQKIEDTHLDQVLDWYLKNIKKDFMPVIRSASSFRTKFERVRERMNKTGAQVKNIAPNVQKIVKRLSDLAWALKQLDQLEPACQITYDNYKEWYDQFKDHHRKEKADPNYAINKTDKVKGLYGFPDRLMSNFLANPDEFVVIWFNDLFRIHRNNSYHSLTELAFTSDNERFHEWGEQLAHQFGDRRLWNKTLTKYGFKPLGDRS